MTRARSRDRPVTTRAANGPPPMTAATLYPGQVFHARLGAVPHRFSYRVFTLLIDLDRLDEADRLSPLFSVGRSNLMSFHPRDHGPRDGSPLRPHVDRLLAAHGLTERAGRVLLLCYPRVAGYVFNPLSVYFAYDRDGALAALIYEVRNTFGEIHSYVEPVQAGQIGPEGVRQKRRKTFYVSPFLDMNHLYNFHVLPPGAAVRLRILQSDAHGPALAAAFSGGRQELCSRTILSLCLKIPLMTLKVTGGIHWEAMKLWLKGAPFHSPARRPRADVHRHVSSPEGR